MGTDPVAAEPCSRAISPVQKVLLRSADSKTAAATWREPDVWLRLAVDEDDRWSATMFGPALDCTASNAVTVSLAESARLLADAAAHACRPLWVHTTDEHGTRYADLMSPPTPEYHQVPTSGVDAVANADAIRNGLPSAAWSPDRVVWDPTPFRGRSRRRGGPARRCRSWRGTRGT